jgi:quercetin dioxygenase-like cupin family protein
MIGNLVQGGSAMLKKSILAATLVAFALGTAAIAQNPPVSPSPIKRTPIGKTEVPGSNYEVISAAVEIAAGFKAGRHFHPGVVQVQVIDGEFWIAIDGQPEKTYTAGQSFELPRKAIHNEGAVGSKPAKLIVVYVVEKGQPLVNPVK